MTKTSYSIRVPWLGCLLLLAVAIAPSCTKEKAGAGEVALNDASEALTQAEYDCERTKRECLIAADCDAARNDACESAFHACREPLHDEKARVRALCRAQRDACEAAAAGEGELHACHVAEHECKLPIDPPEAICHIDALQCIWDAHVAGPDGSVPDAAPHHHHHHDAAEHACREEERACKASRRLHRSDLPKPPRCEPPPCEPADAAVPADAEAPDSDAAIPDPEPGAPGSAAHFECERDKRECLIAADCDPDARVACERTFRACEEPVRAEKKRVHDLCRDERRVCDAAATDEADRHACHVAAHRCTLPVDPPEAFCRIEAHECRWAARSAADPIAAEQVCHDAERACVEENRLRREDLPRPPHCPPRMACEP